MLVGGGLVVAAVVGAFDGDDPTASAALRVDRFDRDRAFADLRYQVELGPRPAGSDTSKQSISATRVRSHTSPPR